MSDAAKKRTIRILTHAAMLYLLYVLQALVFSRLPILGVAPLILPLAVVGVALFEGPEWGGWFGLAAGVFCDVALGSTALFTVVLTAIGLGVGLLSTYLLSRGFPSYFLCAGAALLVIAVLQLFPLLIFLRQPPLALLWVAGLQTLYSVIFTVPLYYLARGLGRQGARV